MSLGAKGPEYTLQADHLLAGYIAERFEDLRFRVGGNVLSSFPYVDDLFPLYNGPEGPCRS